MNDIFENIVIYILDVVRDIFRFERYLVIPLLRFFPLESLAYDFFFCEREMFLDDGFIVGKRRKFRRKEFSIFIYSSLGIGVGHIIHVLYDFRHKFFVFFFRVLLVQDAVLLVAQTNAAEKI